MTRIIAPVLTLGLVVLAGCESKPSQPRPVTSYNAPQRGDATRMSAKELAHHTGMTAAAAVAAAGIPEGEAATARKRVLIVRTDDGIAPPAPPAPPTQPVVAETNRPAPAIAITVRSDKLHETKSKAKYDALLSAQIALTNRLRELEPPIDYRPSLTVIETEYLKKVTDMPPNEQDKADFKKAGVNPNMQYAEVTIELTEAQVSRLRSTDRVNDGLRIAGVAFAILAAAYGFLRLDAWSKGYLTLWLALAAAALVAGAGFLAIRG